MAAVFGKGRSVPIKQVGWYAVDVLYTVVCVLVGCSVQIVSVDRN